MNKICFVVLSLLIVFSLTVTVQATTQYQPTLAVVSFENHSQVNVPDVENMGIQFLESAIANSGMFTLVDRQTVDKNLEELGFNAASGLVDPSYSIQLGKMLGAQYIATGSVVDITQKVTEFKGYNIHTKRVAISVTTGLRVIDAERGTVFFVDQNVAAQENLPINTQNVYTSDQTYSIYQTLMKQSILKSVNNLNQKVIRTRPETPTVARKIPIPIDSEPDGADVEIMGIFYGNTPCEIPLEEGKILEIKVSLGGYEPWIKRVNIHEGLEIRAKLHKKPISESSGSNVKVNVGVQTEKSDKTDDMIQMEKVD
ncbi:MAG: penicillin-binding protein activator [Candidatus Atribacteria bacterium]|nr:penicillin-binding protein activator [Candidatus Atribacteria bacterium]